MAELTAEIVRTIIKEEIAPLKTDVSELKADVSDLKTDVSGLQEDVGGLKKDNLSLHKKIDALRDDTLEAINKVLTTVQELHDEDQDEFAGVKGQLRFHNERIAKLERLGGLR